MTTKEVIKQADALRQNCIEAEAKANILRELESEYAELMGVELPENLWPEDQALLIPAPHDNSYVWHLCAGIDLMNAETDLYANDKVVANSKLYRCERTGEQPGGKVTLQFLPHELVGLYFTEVKET